jgi:hypothetical protein
MTKPQCCHTIVGHDFEPRDNGHEHTVKIAISTTQPYSDNLNMKSAGRWKEQGKEGKGARLQCMVSHYHSTRALVFIYMLFI